MNASLKLMPFAGVNIVGQPGGWGLVIQYGMIERVLAAKRGAIRIFRKFETLVSYLKDMGITNYQVDASNFDPVAWAAAGIADTNLSE